VGGNECDHPTWHYSHKNLDNVPVSYKMRMYMPMTLMKKDVQLGIFHCINCVGVIFKGFRHVP